VPFPRNPDFVGRSDDLETPSPSDRPPAPAGPAKVVPQGLRSFEPHHSGFFLGLLPGPRDRDGVPESVHSWKSQVEGTCAGEPFRVAVLYGPSGSGKSSFVKAGLLPSLDRRVAVAYVVATPDATENDLLKAVRRGCPALTADKGLEASLAALGRGSALPPGGKVFIVLDQFEQWLNSHRGEDGGELVSALRFCDGHRLQCLVLVRDGFDMAARLFLSEQLGILRRLDHYFEDNYPFHQDHARKVLKKFGRAYDRFSGRLTAAQEKFLDRAVKELEEDGRVSPVQLSLFAWMVQSRPWTPATLDAVGGLRGVGFAFLEANFGDRATDPVHRRHRAAARAVLEKLSPERGGDLKRRCCSRQDLLVASGYGQRNEDFDELMSLLDGKLRLVTPTVTGDPAGAAGPDRYYQLTHEYLVPVVRRWLDEKHQATPRGRALLRLRESAARWADGERSRDLPSLGEWLDIWFRTRGRDRSETQRRMMSAATVFYSCWAGAALAALALVFGVIVSLYQRTAQVAARLVVDELKTSETREILLRLPRLEDHRAWATPLLEQEARGDGPGLPPEPARPTGFDVRLVSWGDDKEVKSEGKPLIVVWLDINQVLRFRVFDAKGKPLTDYDETHWPLQSGRISALKQWLPILMQLEASDKDQKRQIAKEVTSILGQPRGLSATLALALRISALKQRLATLMQLEALDKDQKRQIAKEVTSILGQPRGLSATLALALLEPGRLTEGQLSEVCGWIAEARDVDHLRVARKLLGKPEGELRGRAVRVFRAILERVKKNDGYPAVRAANAAAALLRLNDPEPAWCGLGQESDHLLRTYLIRRIGEMGVPPSVITDKLKLEQHKPATTLRRALILSLVVYLDPAAGLGARGQVDDPLLNTLYEIYRTDDDPGVHSAAGLALLKWGREGPGLREAVDTESAGRLPGPKRGWYVTRTNKHTLSVLPGPAGSGRRFAIATTEVTVEQFRAFCSSYKYYNIKTMSPDESCPAAMLSWHAAAKYCCWLNDQENLSRGAWSYKTGADPARTGDWCYREGEVLERKSQGAKGEGETGYRLPTVEEWMLACRAGIPEPLENVGVPEMLSDYAWYVEVGHGRLNPVGVKMPNANGLFDMIGNVREWTHGADSKGLNVLGGGISQQLTEFRDDLGEPKGSFIPRDSVMDDRKGSNSIGFRIARTLPP
jgi:hypothetical protein